MENFEKYVSMVKLDDSDILKISEKANELVKSFNALSDIKTDGIEPMYTVLDIKNIMREDISKKLISRDELLANAPMQYDGYFQVPKTI